MERPRDHCGRRAENMQEREVVDEYKRNSVFWAQLSSSTHDLGLAVIPNPRPVEA